MTDETHSGDAAAMRAYTAHMNGCAECIRNPYQKCVEADRLWWEYMKAMPTAAELRAASVPAPDTGET